MSRSGYTLVEVIVVIAIVAALSAIGFSISGPARERGRQAACASQFKQIYAALALYAADYDEGDYAELHGLTYIGSRNRNLADTLKPYGFVREFNFCPSSSIRLKERLPSTYMWPICIEPYDENGQLSRSRKEMVRLESIFGLALPIVECHIHDELYYAPAEQEIDPKMATPFRIILRADGSVKSGRTYPPRTSIFSDLAYGSR